MSEESSIHSGACSSAWQAFTTFGQSSRATWPLRSLSPGIRAWLATKRWASSVSDISSENSATGLAVLDRDVLGDVRDQRALAHRGPRGEHDQVRLLEAAGDVVEVAEAGRRAGDSTGRRARAARACRSPRARISSIERKSLARSSAWATSNSMRSASSTSWRGSPRAVGDATLDRLRDAEQPPQRGLLLDELARSGGRCRRSGPRAASWCT